jgi:hypothetical protein
VIPRETSGEKKTNFSTRERKHVFCKKSRDFYGMSARDALLSRFQQNVLLDQESHGMLSLFGSDPSSQQQQGLDDVELGFQFEQHHYDNSRHNGGAHLFSFGHGDDYNENHIFRSDSDDRGDDDDEVEVDHNVRRQEESDRENMFNNIEDLLVDGERKHCDGDNGMAVEVPPTAIVASEQQHQTTRDTHDDAIVLGADDEPLNESEYRMVLMVHLIVRRDEQLLDRVKRQAELQARQTGEMEAFTRQVDPRIVKRATVREVLDTVREQQLRDLSPDDLQLLFGHLNAARLWSLVSANQWSLCHTCYQDYLILTIGPAYHIIRARNATI